MLEDDKISPNIKKNPLPTHRAILGGSMNALEKDEEELEEDLNIGELEIPMKELFNILAEIKYIKLEPLIIR